MKTRLLIIGLILWSYGVTFALAQSPVTVEVDRQTLSVYEQLELKIMVTEKSLTISPFLESFNLPDFAVEGSASSVAYTNVNGQVAIKSVYVFQLRPLRVGQLLIPSLPIEVDGQILLTDPIEIEVTDAPPTDSSPLNPQPLPDSVDTPPPFIVEATIDNPTPYLGEQVVYTFRLYRSSMMFPNQPDYQAPPFTNFWSQTVLSKPAYSTMISETNYSVIEVRTAIFPATLGEIKIAPAKLTIPGVLSVDQTLETPSVTVMVRSLPPQAPPSFKGAVGQYTMRVTLDHEMGKVNEPLTLAIDIEGFGNISILNEPPLPKLEHWRIFNSKPTTTIEPRERGVYGTRRFERLIFPSQAGDYTLPPIEFSYYDPKAQAYKIIRSDPIPVTIAPDDTVKTTSDAVEIAIPNIQGLKPAPTYFSRNTDVLWRYPFYWSGWLGALVMVALAWGWHKQRARFMAFLTKPTRPRGYQAAQKILQSATQDSPQSATVVQQALYTYFAVEYDYPLSRLSNAQILTLCQAHNVSLELQQRVRALLTQIDIERFAPVSSKNLAALMQQTQELLHDLAQLRQGH